MKLCKDCAWNEKEYCYNPKLFEVSMVTGEMKRILDSPYNECQWVREHRCGKKAKWFVDREGK